MDERKQRVLRAIIDDYTVTAEPVASATVARKCGLGVSAATIRNEMADLEEQGYLEQPHASAGRIPSDKGWRYYVDAIVERKPLSEPERQRIFETLAAHRREVADLAHTAVRLLSGATNCLVMLMGPGLSGAHCRLVQLVPFQPGRVLMVLVTEEGFLHSASVDLDMNVNPDDLSQASSILSDRFQGWPLEDVQAAFSGARFRESNGNVFSSLFAAFSESLRDRLEVFDRQPVFLGGATNLLRQPEFRSVERASGLLSALEEEAAARLLSTFGREGVSVAIGEEIPSPPVDDCSVVAAGYFTGSRLAGRVGVLGPRRMDYAVVMTMVDEISQCVTEILTHHTG